MMEKLETELRKIFLEKLPPLSPNVKEGLAKYLPWIIIVFGVLGLLCLFSILGMFTAAARMAGGYTGIMSLIIVISAIIQILGILAGYWMLSRQLRGWQLALLTSLTGFVVNIIHFSLFGIIIDFVFVYLLFQIREYYPR
ncbi:MAG TPA: hypothetical protein PKA28_05555 [Methylomusa anaerophila]|uniref:Yip1 domain protein n=1 Tax=Methylomusa anaerophila TaxID=1930071 RepID=A0A348ALZ0_9FIRM|nr:hypothetical protein [Methylomusa anaerophila]BBB92088.1 hypothetical protein MAMMFC1_02773 [Methylomusa anaerophila]HML87898.1 hypothetical protein [Methylomusa anaerophila]